MSWKELSSHIRIVDDPKKMAQLNPEVELRRLGLSQKGKS
jgi:hypothetical protein